MEMDGGEEKMENSNEVEDIISGIEVREFDDIGAAAGVLHEVLFPSKQDLEGLPGPDSIFPHVLMVLAEGVSLDTDTGDMGMTTEQVIGGLSKMLGGDEAQSPSSKSKFSRLVYNYVSHGYGSTGKNPGCIEYVKDDVSKKPTARWMITPKGYEHLWNHVVNELSKGSGFDALGVWFCERMGVRGRSDRLSEKDLFAPALLALVLTDESLSTRDLRERVRTWVAPKGENVQVTGSDKSTAGMDRFARTFHNLLTSHKTLLRSTGSTNSGRMPLVVRGEDGAFSLTPAGKSKLCRKFTTEFVAQKRQISAMENLTKLDDEYGECAAVTSFLIKHDGTFGSEELDSAARKLSVELGRRAEEYHEKMLSLFEVMQTKGRRPQRKP